MVRNSGKIKALIFLSLFILFINFVNGLDTFEQNSRIDLIQPVRINGGIVSGINCNVTVYYPNNSLLVDFKQMTDNGDYFNYTLTPSQTGTKGIYNYDVTCFGGGLNETESFNFLINLGGIEPSDSRTHTQTRNILVFFGVAILCFISIFFIKQFPIKLTLFLLMIWFILMGINFVYLAIGDEVLNSKVENFFSFFLTMSFYANYFIFISIGILWMITMIINAVQISKRRKAKKYGFEGF